MLDQFGLLHLLAQAHRRLDQLPPDLAATVRSRVGYPVSKDDVLARPGVTDHWLALGVVAWAMTALFDKERRFLHDRLAGTRLVSMPKPASTLAPGATPPAAEAS